MAKNEFEDYYKKVFKKYYRTPEEAEIIGEHTYDFAYYVLQHPEMMEPLYKFFIDLTFEGPDEYTKALVEKTIVEQAYIGVTKIDIEQSFAREVIAALDSRSLEENDYFKEEVFEVFEDIRKKDPQYIFYELDWNFFVLQMNSINGFQILFKVLDKDNQLTLFGKMFEEKANKCGMKVVVDGIPEEDIEALLAKSEGEIKNAEKVRKLLSNKVIAYLDLEPLGEFDKVKHTSPLVITQEDIERYENTRQKHRLLRLSSKR